MKKERALRTMIFFVDFLLLNISFLLVSWWEQRIWHVSGGHSRLLIGVYFLWLPIFFLAKKNHLDIYFRFRRAVIIYVKSALFLAYGLSFLIVFLGWGKGVSRFQVFGTCLAWLLLELLLMTLAHFVFGKLWNHGHGPVPHSALFKSNISAFLFFSDLLLFFGSFFLINLLKRGSFKLVDYYPEFLLLSFGFWIALSLFTRKYDRANFQNLYFAIAACIKTALLMGAVMSVVIFAFRLFYFSRFQIFGSLMLLLALEIGLFYLYSISSSRIEKNYREDVESIESVRRFLDQELLPTKSVKHKESVPQVPSHMRVLMDSCVTNFPDLFDFVRKTVDLSSLDDSEIALLNCQESTCVDVLKDKSFRLVINFQRINDILWLNRYFLAIHKKLFTGGYFIGRVDSMESHKKRFFRTWPKYYREFFYIFYFLFFRLLPRLSQTRKLYFSLSKGRCRSISRAEALGRLYFCGFKVLAEQELDDGLFFVAQKSKTPSLNKSPSFSPIIRLNRVGWNGQVIQICKFRTMHPYSEYLQEYIYEQNRLKEGGKIKDDFRVTEWGRFFRKYWIDELPMIYNWFRGEIKLFGVRPLSQHYLSLYDASAQEMRRKIKPGLIPPYYADMPKELGDIIEGERRYILNYRLHPWKTQFVYFLRSLNNILLKGARSG